MFTMGFISLDTHAAGSDRLPYLLPPDRSRRPGRATIWEGHLDAWVHGGRGWRRVTQATEERCERRFGELKDENGIWPLGHLTAWHMPEHLLDDPGGFIEELSVINFDTTSYSSFFSDFMWFLLGGLRVRWSLSPEWLHGWRFARNQSGPFSVRVVRPVGQWVQAEPSTAGRSHGLLE